jgi:hypothetical protein
MLMCDDTLFIGVDFLSIGMGIMTSNGSDDTCGELEQFGPTVCKYETTLLLQSSTYIHGICLVRAKERLHLLLVTDGLAFAMYYDPSARLICNFLSSPPLTIPTSLSHLTLKTLTPSP